ncbi:hypothetical protein TthSNM66_21940 (plasmid) [Thermus thermophilus]|uniref:hypothetical protein n=1 Tax=Thermus thermophilus TaxID=274 RepID=UPI001FCA6C77|nr:hypothetical protein [Thermus thermophilus]BDG27558.1 hypothetical protein TthSNM66_21940 [Thermus thermophilus]
MKVLILTVGTTREPLEVALAEHAPQEALRASGLVSWGARTLFRPEVDGVAVFAG